jgi:hypothetical protein
LFIFVFLKGNVMAHTRRAFMKEAAIAGAVVAAAPTVTAKSAGADVTPVEERCPFFDQPMFCGGADENGKFKCDE